MNYKLLFVHDEGIHHVIQLGIDRYYLQVVIGVDDLEITLILEIVNSLLTDDFLVNLKYLFPNPIPFLILWSIPELELMDGVTIVISQYRNNIYVFQSHLPE